MALDGNPAASGRGIKNLIKIDSIGNIIWKVPDGTWNDRKGKAMVSLLVNRVSEFKNERLSREERPLRLKIEAYSIKKDGSYINRLIKDWYFITDEPFGESGSGLWSSWGNEKFEYGLAGIWVYPKEEVTITLHITQTDIVLQKGNPRLKVSGDYDSAAVPWVALFVIIYYGIITVLVIIFLMFLYLIWRKYKKTNYATYPRHTVSSMCRADPRRCDSACRVLQEWSFH